jgi:hypothetical protein
MEVCFVRVRLMKGMTTRKRRAQMRERSVTRKVACR